MKNIYLLLIILLASFKIQSQTTISDFFKALDEVYENLDPSLINTGILLDQGFRSIDQFALKNEIQSDYYHYWAIYTNLQKCKKASPEDKLLPKFETLVNWENYKENSPQNMPLSFIYYKGNYIGTNEALKLIENKKYVPQISAHSFFALSPMIPSIHSSEVTFELDDQLIFSNQKGEIKQLEIDFGDGYGFRTINAESGNITVKYSCTGEKSIVAKLHTNTGIHTANSKLRIKSMDMPQHAMHGEIKIDNHLKSTGNGDVTGGSYTYELSSDNVLDRPIFIVEGFDLTNTESSSDLYSGWSNTLSSLRARGYDIFCLSFDNARKSMDINKEVVKAFIRKINNAENKVGNHEGVIIGESMGGVLARMALKEMENKNEDHKIGLYVSFDAPHKGANVPPGLQWGFKDAVSVVSDISELIVPFLVVYQHIFGDVISSDIINSSLNSAAAKQLLSRHITEPDDFNNMQASLKALGYPQDSRNIALINGNNQGENLPFTLGHRFFHHKAEFTAFLGTYHSITVNSTEINTTNQLVSDMQIVSLIPTWKPPYFGPTYNNDKRYFTSDNKAYDNCPGGKYAINSDLLDINEFSFVPTSSSIDLDESIFNTDDGLHYLNATNTKDNIINNGLTPFDDIYASEKNTQHVNHGQWDAPDNPLAKLFANEIMHFNMYIQNRTINHSRDFQATRSVTVGNDVDHQSGKNIKKGDVTFKSGTTTRVSAPSINLEQGTVIESGCNFSAEYVSGGLKSDAKSLEIVDISDNFTPSISRKTINESIVYYLTNVTKSDQTTINWSIFSDDYEYKTSDYEIVVPHDIPAGQYTLKAEVLSEGKSPHSVTLVFNRENKTSKVHRSKLAKQEPSEHFTYEVFPNPSNEFLEIQHEKPEAEFTAVLFDLKGNKLIEKEFTGNGIIDMSEHKGFFLLKITEADKTTSRKIVSH